MYLRNTAVLHLANIVITMKPIKTMIRPMGNSQGIIIPRLVLAQVGLEDEAEMIVERDALVIRKPTQPARAGWGEFSKKIAAADDNALVMGGFTNESDPDLNWGSVEIRVG